MEAEKKPSLPITCILSPSLEILTDATEYNTSSSLCMCRLPGKSTYSNHSKPSRKLKNDFESLSKAGVTDILCLINKYEMRAKGVDIDNYIKLCKEHQIDPHFYEINEMSPPKSSPSDFKNELIEKLKPLILSGERKLAVHCQAGIGRAGLVVSCLLMDLNIAKGPNEVILALRKIRHPNCVESRSQRDYVKEYYCALTGKKVSLNLKPAPKSILIKKPIPRESYQKERSSTLSSSACISEILPGLYISSAKESRDRSLLLSHSITHIVVGGHTLSMPFPKNFTYHRIPLFDVKSFPLLSYLPSLLGFTSCLGDSSSLLLHCLVGASRSVSLCASLLMLANRWDSEETLAFIRGKRSVACVNEGFRNRLREWETVCKRYWGDSLLHQPHQEPRWRGEVDLQKIETLLTEIGVKVWSGEKKREGTKKKKKAYSQDKKEEIERNVMDN